MTAEGGNHGNSGWSGEGGEMGAGRSKRTGHRQCELISVLNTVTSVDTRQRGSCETTSAVRKMKL